MIVIYSIYSFFVLIMTLSVSLFYVITCWWILLFPNYYRFRIFEYLIAKPWAFLFLRVFLLIRLKIIGNKYIDKKHTTFYICNHQSWVDVPILYACSHSIGVSKKEVKRLPLVGLLIIYSGGVIIVDRDNVSSRIAIIKEIIKVFKKGFSIFLFPEGTRSKDGKLLKPNNAIVKLCHKINIPVVPASIEGTIDILPRNRFYYKFFKKVILKFNPPMFPKDYKNEEEFAKACWKKVEETHEDIIKEYFPNKLSQLQ